MDILQYDNKHVRITIFDGSVYEGIVTHNSASYDGHEFGREEEGLQMPSLLIYKDDIQSVESLEYRDPSPGSAERRGRCRCRYRIHSSE